jgi:hypothetical protein
VPGAGVQNQLSSGNGGGQQLVVGGRIQGVGGPVRYQSGHPNGGDTVSGGSLPFIHAWMAASLGREKIPGCP